jgi:hypothetical protein
VRYAAAEAIYWLDPANRDRMIPTLRALIAAADPVRPGEVWRPMDLLLRADPSAGRSLVPTFVGWLRHEDARARHHAVRCLVGLGTSASEAVPALEALLNTGKSAERARVALAIIAIDPAGCDRAAACLLALLRDAGIAPEERIAALGPLSRILNQDEVPPRIRDAAIRIIRAVPDEPGVLPEFGRRVRLFLEYQDSIVARSTASAARPAHVQ